MPAAKPVKKPIIDAVTCPANTRHLELRFGSARAVSLFLIIYNAEQMSGNIFRKPSGVPKAVIYWFFGFFVRTLRHAKNQHG